VALDTLDKLVAAVAGGSDGTRRQMVPFFHPSRAGGNIMSMWRIGGYPAQGAIPAQAGVVPTRTTPGAMYFNNPAAGEDTHLSRLWCVQPQQQHFILIDRLWHAGLPMVNSATYNFSTAPDRGDLSGYDVELGFENYAAGMSNVTPTVNYTDADGNARSFNTVTNPAIIAGGQGIDRISIPPIGQTGNNVRGVRSVQSVVMPASAGTGTVGVVLFRRIAAFAMLGGNMGYPILDGVFECGLTKIPNDACLSLLSQVPSGSTEGPTHGYIELIQG
jgi:hypothetical protein